MKNYFVVAAIAAFVVAGFSGCGTTSEVRSWGPCNSPAPAPVTKTTCVTETRTMVPVYQETVTYTTNVVVGQAPCAPCAQKR